MNAIANTIAQQLGGTNRLSAMIGAKNFVAGEETLTFRTPMRTRNGANMITVRLTSADLYDVEFKSLRGVSLKSKGEVFGIYADRLKATIEEATGLYLSL